MIQKHVILALHFENLNIYLKVLYLLKKSLVMKFTNEVILIYKIQL